MKNRLIILALLFIIVASCEQSETDSNDSLTTSEEKPDVSSNSELPGANVLTFGPDNVLFIGDSKGAKVLAVKTDGQELKDPVPYNLEGFDALVAEKLNLELRDVIINDMKIHPASQEAYVSIKKGHQPDATSVIAIVNPITSDIRFLKVDESNSSSVSIRNPASSDLTFWNETPATTLSITDIDYNDGFIYVAGLTNGEFASTLRKIPYPFSEDQEVVKGIEIYHAVHTQNETRAPIRTMLFDELNGESTLIASYTCTPLVTIPTAEIVEGADIRGKTIAELGYGNTPIDMLVVTTQGFDGSLSKSLLVTHKNRGGTMIPFQSVAEGSKGKGMAGKQAMFAAGLGGIQQIPTANIMQMDVQNAQMLSVIRRNIENGEIDLVSELTGTFLRLSDFISEYDFPDYRYPEQQAQTKKYHDQVKQMEGYPDLISSKMGR